MKRLIEQEQKSAPWLTPEEAYRRVRAGLDALEEVENAKLRRAGNRSGSLRPYTPRPKQL
jgi:hypothetical protein